ncbi:hypothetical protein ABGT15_08975 [Flavobacterium enshiense]|uniref:hypothetical protein n=1 Tax=Flavobacterium enshiense TaxID=1341165 RepID=UPI00345D6F15
MKDFNDIQNLWNQQETKPLPDVTQIIAKSKKDKQDFTNKIIVQTTILALTLPCLLWIGSIIDFKKTTSYIGLTLMFCCVFIFSAIRLYQIIRLKKMDVTAEPQINLQKLEQYYSFQKLVSTKITAIYFIVMNIAFGFYFIEVMAPMSALLKATVLIAYVAWMLFAFFYLGKKQKAKEYARIQHLIDTLKEIEKNYEK